ncbi:MULTISPECIES: flavodoxin family protein [Bacillus]|uniref:Flavodoxin family protein n=2 Tax=Bacillus cereus group TaxID=86661 RepID=A0A2C1DQN8_BACCE|nr:MULTISPECIES: flavodoxin family protein [Bacillus cereus group]OFD71227.1 NAD(P)H-dependent oxidoreductase [Bacillus mycoides]OFD71898.1 NAD(P)H-dependent oxidoreductase [Bacillus mycoides]OFD74851.1 NAD(P)H-dependent oxidoreductase [Bacillus mycoides]PGT02388.1 flavodoxin family protein [Bacillus cereus]
MFVIHGSSRQNGNTEALTHMVIDGIETEQIYLRDHIVHPIIDQRHDAEGFQPVNDDYKQLLERMLEHDTIIFATPLYWYGMSGHMKNFVDRWSQSLRDISLHFKEKMKGKKMYVVIVGGDNPKLKALPLIAQFQYIFDFVGSSFEGYVIGDANGLDEIQNDAEAIANVQLYNNKFKNSQQK